MERTPENESSKFLEAKVPVIDNRTFRPFVSSPSGRFAQDVLPMFSAYSVKTPGAVALLVARRTNDRKVAGTRPTKVVCITVLTDNRLG